MLQFLCYFAHVMKLRKKEQKQTERDSQPFKIEPCNFTLPKHNNELIKELAPAFFNESHQPSSFLQSHLCFMLGPVVGSLRQPVWGYKGIRGIWSDLIPC